MTKDFDYERTYQLKHNEAPAKINMETGEVKKIGEARGKPNPDFQKFDLMPVYHRLNPVAWEFLESQTTDSELKCALKLAHLAKAFTNSLVPLNDETTLVDLSDTLGVNRNIVERHIDRLFKLGVIGKFEVYDDKQRHTKYWVFNPYLAFNGDKIRRDVVTLFDKTTIAMITRGSRR